MIFEKLLLIPKLKLKSIIVKRALLVLYVIINVDFIKHSSFYF